MTLQNAKRLFAHFTQLGKKDKADEQKKIIESYSESVEEVVEDIPQEVEPTLKKEKNKK